MLQRFIFSYITLSNLLPRFLDINPSNHLQNTLIVFLCFHHYCLHPFNQISCLCFLLDVLVCCLTLSVVITYSYFFDSPSFACSIKCTENELANVIRCSRKPPELIFYSHFTKGSSPSLLVDLTDFRVLACHLA